MFKLYGLDKEEGPKKDRRRFEAELPDVDKPHSSQDGNVQTVRVKGKIDQKLTGW